MYLNAVPCSYAWRADKNPTPHEIFTRVATTSDKRGGRKWHDNELLYLFFEISCRSTHPLTVKRIFNFKSTWNVRWRPRRSRNVFSARTSSPSVGKTRLPMWRLECALRNGSNRWASSCLRSFHGGESSRISWPFGIRDVASHNNGARWSRYTECAGAMAMRPLYLPGPGRNAIDNVSNQLYR